MTGTIGILNVGAGDTKISFDPANPAEAARASRIVKDMLRRGFALLVQVGEVDGEPTFRRAKDFDETTAEYIIAGTPDDFEAETHDKKPTSTPRRAQKARKVGEGRRIPAASTRGVAVARTAGG